MICCLQDADPDGERLQGVTRDVRAADHCLYSTALPGPVGVPPLSLLLALSPGSRGRTVAHTARCARGEDLTFIQSSS